MIDRDFHVLCPPVCARSEHCTACSGPPSRPPVPAWWALIAQKYKQAASICLLVKGVVSVLPPMSNAKLRPLQYIQSQSWMY
ncbi:hypothetical protein RR42_s2691 [Cupriavidus basilensis]|uniref:Uncharacterized protein n=1 Tax=Cupriavidus basilensis TaxID=68895 RepID=A0A0C4YMM1_9BURK|nr:hypothetical protein RR42_s2691 [Cupriavidus basilensis]